MATGYGYATGYQAYETEDEAPETGLLAEEHPPQVHYSTLDGRSGKWSQIPDLDDFFIRVYNYFFGHGFFCMVLDDLFQLGQFIFILLFTGFLAECVDYDVLFATKAPQTKQTFKDVIRTECNCGFGIPGMTVFLLIGFAFLAIRTMRKIYEISKNWQIKEFYRDALELPDSDLSDTVWSDVLTKLKEVQIEKQLCIHKTELTELDIYHRILRFKNYKTAMVNKSVLPLKLWLPFIGEFNYLSHGLKYNIEMILFYGPFNATPFESPWTLRNDYKNLHKRAQIADRLSRLILIVGIVNLLLSPIILLWGILYIFFQYGELLKRNPSYLGSRMWSLYSKIYLRHFNEPDHELNTRLNKSYKISDDYLSGFLSPSLCIVAKNVRFLAGSILIVLVLLTVYDEDTLHVENMLTLMTGLGIVLTVSHIFIPDENAVFCPEVLMQRILSFTHYQPDSWRGRAHTGEVRQQFSQLFQFKAIHLLHEVLSPIVTPFYLIFILRPRSLELVDFFRNFTVEVQGVGDVCSYALMDVRRHGNPKWSPGGTERSSNPANQAELGKTEISLVHFALTNPSWKPTEEATNYLESLRERVNRDADILETGGESALSDSMNGLISPNVSQSVPQSTSNRTMGSSRIRSSIAHSIPYEPRRTRNTQSQYLTPERNTVQGGILDTLRQSAIHGGLSPSLQNVVANPNYDTSEASLSVIYLHELRHRNQLPTIHHDYETLEHPDETTQINVLQTPTQLSDTSLSEYHSVTEIPAATSTSAHRTARVTTENETEIR